MKKKNTSKVAASAVIFCILIFLSQVVFSWMNLLCFFVWRWFLVCSISLVSRRRLAQALKEAAAREQEQAAKAAGGGRSSFQV